MKAYKATNNMKCQTLTYEVGKTYTFNGKLKMCSMGFHFCTNPKDVLGYYGFNKDFALMEIEVLGEVITKDDKSVTNKLKVTKVFTQEEIILLLDIVNEYDEKGNQIHLKDSKGCEEWNEYDEKGNQIHHKDFKGYECWKEYDEKGNLIYYKDSYGYEVWKEYDEKGNLIYYKDSNGHEEWNEYDEKSNLIRYKNSNGYGGWNEYDEKGNLIHYKDSSGKEWSIEIG